MPELAEVYYHSQQWGPGLKLAVDQVRGHPRARIFREVSLSMLRESLVGREFGTIQTHGKQMRFGFSGETWLGLHLGMTGSLQAGPTTDWQSPPKDAHFLLDMKGGLTLIFRDSRQFGCLRWWQDSGKPTWWPDHLPQPHEEEFTLEYFRNALAAHRRLAIKPALLLQKHFPGIGNWMADEILWRARIRPQTLVGSLGSRRLVRLHEEMVFVSEWALAQIGQTLGDPPASWLFPHRWKDGGSCPQTGQPLRRITLGGRTTCWSPAWQR